MQMVFWRHPNFGGPVAKNSSEGKRSQLKGVTGKFEKPEYP